MVRKISHIAVAVKDVEVSAKLFQTLLGIAPGHTETLPAERVRVAFFKLGDSRIELVEGIGSENPTAEFTRAMVDAMRSRDVLLLDSSGAFMD